uniref:SAP domain-containing protein n=1 Tax=Hyaloperonospora arabidopsidis (strain Emoy2) TaxID=559515 RepID=M4B7F8_HYAAE
MGDAVLRVHSRLQLLARENWLALEESHVRNLSWLQEEFLQISRSLDVKARLNQPRLDASEPLYRGHTFDVAGPKWKKHKTDRREEVEAPTAAAIPCQERETKRLSMRLRAREPSTDVAGGAGAPRTRKRGRSSAALLQDPGKLKVTELRVELKERGLRTSGLKAALFDRLLNALEKEQKEESKHLDQVEKVREMKVQDKEAIVIVDDSDKEEIVRESVGSNKSQPSVLRSQSTSPKATAEKSENVEQSPAKVEGRQSISPLLMNGKRAEGESHTGCAAQTEEASVSSEAASATDVVEEQQLSAELDNVVSSKMTSSDDCKVAVTSHAETVSVHDELKMARKSMQVGGKSELTSPLVWKRKSILRKASSLAPCTQVPARNVSFAPTDKVDVIVDNFQTDFTQPDPSPEKRSPLVKLYVPRNDSKCAGSDSCSDASMTPKSVRTSVASSSPLASPNDPSIEALSKEETERQHKKREYDETVQREAQKFRLAAKLSAQKRLEEARASQVLWAKGDQLRSRLLASAAGEKRRSARTPLADKAVSDKVSPLLSESSTVTGSTSKASDTNSLTASATRGEARSSDTTPLDDKLVESTRSLDRRQGGDIIPDVTSGWESVLHQPKVPVAPYSILNDKDEGEPSIIHRLGVEPAAESLPTTKRVPQEFAESRFPCPEDELEKLDRPSFVLPATSHKDVIKPESPKGQTAPPLLVHKLESLSSMVPSVPKPPAVETALKTVASTITNDARRPISNLVSGLHSFTTLLEKNQSQEKTAVRSAPVLNALKLAEKSRVLEEKKRLEKERRKVMLKKKMEEHKKIAALKERAEKEAQAKREQDRLNVRKKREAELAKQRQQKLKEMRAGLEKKRAMLAAEKKAVHVASASLVSKSTTTAAGASHQRHGGLSSASEASQPKPVPVPLQKLESKPIVPKLPQAPKPKPTLKLAPKPALASPGPVKHAPKSHSPDVLNYEMSDNVESSDGDSSDSDADHHGKKKVPKWAQKSHLKKVLHAQFGKNATDPSRAIFQDFVDTCNLEAIFETTDVSKKKKFARRTSSGNWLADRPTARDRALYQRDMGYDR